MLAAAFPDFHDIMVLDNAILNGHKVMHKDSVNFLYQILNSLIVV